MYPIRVITLFICLKEKKINIPKYIRIMFIDSPYRFDNLLKLNNIKINDSNIHLLAKYENPSFFSIKSNYDKDYLIGKSGNLYFYKDDGNKYSEIFCGACIGGHIDIVNLMIEKGVDCWNIGLYCACEGGHIDIVNLMIEKGANDWNDGLYRACTSGNIDIVNLMLKKGANDLNEGLYRACIGGYIDIVNLIIKKGATYCSYCGGHGL